MSSGRYHWSHCARSPRFFVVHAIVVVPFLVTLLFPSWYRFGTAVLLTVFVIYVEKVKKMSIRAFFRSFNLIFTGRVKGTINLLRALAR